MKKGLIIVISIAVVLLLVIVYFVLNSVLATKVNIRGELRITNESYGKTYLAFGIVGFVNGTLLLIDIEKIKPYVGKNVEVIGYIHREKCEPGLQCFGGTSMNENDIISIMVLD